MEEITLEQYKELQKKFEEKRITAMREKIESQLPDVDVILASMSEKYFFEQKLEIMPNLSVVFRTITSKSNDESLRFAIAQTKDVDDYQLFVSTRIRKRLSYGLVSLRGTRMVEELTNESYFEIMMKGLDVDEMLNECSDALYKRLAVMPGSLVEKLAEFYGTWETLVHERLRGEDHFEVGKS